MKRDPNEARNSTYKMIFIGTGLTGLVTIVILGAAIALGLAAAGRLYPHGNRGAMARVSQGAVEHGATLGFGLNRLLVDDLWFAHVDADVQLLLQASD